MSSVTGMSTTPPGWSFLVGKRFNRLIRSYAASLRTTPHGGGKLHLAHQQALSEVQRLQEPIDERAKQRIPTDYMPNLADELATLTTFPYKKSGRLGKRQLTIEALEGLGDLPSSKSPVPQTSSDFLGWLDELLHGFSILHERLHQQRSPAEKRALSRALALITPPRSAP